MLDLIINKESSDFTNSTGAKQVLRDQTIAENEPGTILTDFAVLLEFIGEDGLKTTGKNYFLPQSKLTELNARMSHPAAHRLKRPQQRSFPNLNGLYMILRASGMGTGLGTPPSGRLILDPRMLDAWRDLNVTEQYFTLLESWLVQGSPEIIAERGGWSSGCFHSLTSVSQKLSLHRTTITDNRHHMPLYGTMELVTVALMELFGWVRLEYADPREGEGVKIASIERLELGDAMVSALNAHYLSHQWPAYHDDRPANPGVLQPSFQPYFPAWQATLAQPEWPFRAGTYTWRVSLGRAWRRIVTAADMCLDELAMASLDAFDFDADHLYCFQLRDTTGRKLRIACPYEDDAESFTDDVKLGDLPLPEGGVMTFVFDYGDNWQFTVKLEEVSPTVSKLKRPKVTAQGGRAPAQYAREDEEEEWE